MSSASEQRARDHLMVALDYPQADAALSLVDALGESVRWYKVGLELYLSAGNSVLAELSARGRSIFLDLKLHDIPNTVAGAVRSAVSAGGASLLTVHAAGGPAMVAAAVDAARGSGVQILAVTVLTSMDAAQLAATGTRSSPAEQVELLARMATEAGADGLVCSAEECGRLRTVLGENPLLVVPGIRPAGAALGDQKRVATPGEALRDGASYLVVGRPITQASDPLGAVAGILGEMEAVRTIGVYIA